jgi:hypothetical protein
MIVLGEELGGRPAEQLAGVLGIVSGTLFLGSSMVHSTLLMASERLPSMGTTRRKRTSVVCGLVQKAYVSCVSVFFL